MKRLLTLTLALILTLALAACDAPAKTADADAENADTMSTLAKEKYATVSEEEAVAEEEAAVVNEAAAVNESAPVNEAEAEFADEAGGETTAAETATETKKQEPAICGSYRSVLPAYPMEDAELEELKAAGEDFMIYDYINISQFDDGGFQVEFRLAIGGSGNDYAVFDTEALGTANWYSFYFDGDMGVPNNNGSVTVTADGNTAWVTFEGGEPQEYRKTE